MAPSDRFFVWRQVLHEQGGGVLRCGAAGEEDLRREFGDGVGAGEEDGIKTPPLVGEGDVEIVQNLG